MLAICLVVAALSFGLGYLAQSMTKRRKTGATGTIIVSKDGEKVVYRLELDGDVDEIFAEKNEVLFRVTR